MQHAEQVGRPNKVFRAILRRQPANDTDQLCIARKLQLPQECLARNVARPPDRHTNWRLREFVARPAARGKPLANTRAIRYQSVRETGEPPRKKVMPSRFPGLDAVQTDNKLRMLRPHPRSSHATMPLLRPRS